MLLYPDGDIELVLIQSSSNHIRSVISTDGGESWGLDISRNYGSNVAWSDLNVAIDGDGVAYASYNMDGTLRVISRPAGGDGVGPDDWTAHVDVRSDLSNDEDVEQQSMVSGVGSLGGMLSVSLTNASALAYANNKVATGNAQSCGILANGSLMCWGGGDNWGAQGNGLATNSNLQSPSWVDLGAGLTAESVAFGNHYGCAVLSDGSLKCWGKNDDGQVGDGTTADKHSPVAVSLGTGRTADAVAMGNAHTCALLDNGSVQCWGDDTWGDLGNGAGVTDRLSPSEYVDFGAGRTAVALDVGTDHSCAVLDNGSLMCWGRDHRGQLGNGGTTTADQHSPVFADLGTGRTAIAVSTGHIHTCAILDDGSLKCWGSDDDGRLGNGAVTGDQPSPVLVDLGAGRTAVAVVAAMYNTCAILDDGSLTCWGDDLHGQLANGQTVNADQPSPVSVNLGTGRTAVAISIYALHACAILDDASMKCWGIDAAGSLGNGAGTTTTYVPGLVTGSHTWDVTTTASTASPGTAGHATVSACANGWSSCTTAADWTVDANLSGVNSTTMAMAVDLDQTHFLVHNSSSGAMLHRVGATGLQSSGTLLWPHAVEEISTAFTPQGDLYTAVRNASDGHLWLVRADAVGGIGLAVDLDGDGWLGIDEMACGKDPQDASSTPEDADGDGVCDPHDDVDDDVHPGGSRTIALGDAFGCAITGNVHTTSSSTVHDPAVVCWGKNDEKQGGNTTTTAANVIRQDVGWGVDLPLGTAVVDLDAGERHACTVTTEGDVYCWGANDHGQLGRNTSYASAFPGLVDLPEGVRALGVATGANHTCIHDQRGDVWCWGSNLEGGLGSHVYANPDGVVHLDSNEHDFIVGPWTGSTGTSNRFSSFEDGLDEVQVNRIGCCNHVNTQVQEMDFNVPLDSTLVLNLTSYAVQMTLKLSLNGQELYYSNLGTTDETFSIPVKAGSNTLEAAWDLRTNGYGSWNQFLSLRASLHGIEIVQGEAWDESGLVPALALANSTAPVKTLVPEHPVTGLDSGATKTCATDAGGNSSCWAGYNLQTSINGPSSEWQSLIDNASTVTGCGFTYQNAAHPDPLDIAYVPSGTNGWVDGMTVANHTSLPIDCSGLRVGSATINGSFHLNWEDFHVMPVTPGRTYRIEVFTEHVMGTTPSDVGPSVVRAFSPNYSVSSTSVANQQNSIGSDRDNQLIYTALSHQDIMVVGVESRRALGSISGHSGLIEYSLRVAEVGSPLSAASMVGVKDGPMGKHNAETNHAHVPILGTPDVGAQVCAIPMDGVGLVCENPYVMTHQDYSINLFYEDDANRTTSFSIGETTACAILNGTLACWGNETVGGLGDGGNAISTTATPVGVSLPTGWMPIEVEVSDHGEFACALLRNASNDKQVYCWGPDTEGHLGNGGGLASSPSTAPATPVQFSNDPLDVHTDSFELDRQPWDIAQIVASGGLDTEPCVRSYEGLVKCWNLDQPYDGWGAFDAPNEMGANLPFVDLGTEVYATDLTQIRFSSAQNAAATCALLENGTVTCWGSASFSGVDKSVAGYSTSDVSVNGDDRRVVGTGTSSGVLTGMVDIAQSCGLLSDGTVRCWSSSTNAGTGWRSHAEVDLGGVKIVSLHESIDTSTYLPAVCALHASFIRATCFTVSPSSNGPVITLVRTVTDAQGIHDVLLQAASTNTKEWVLRGPLEFVENGNVQSMPVLKPGSLALNHDLVVCGIGPDSSPECHDGGVEAAPFGGRIQDMDGPCFLRMDAEVLCIGTPQVRGLDGQATESANTAADAMVYGTIDLDLRNPDTDGDGVKDLWDDDDDDDGVLDHEDAFPRDACASVDTDRDGRPNALANACSTPLTEDLDDDNDGWTDLDEGTCGTDALLNTRVPRDLDGDGTCDAADADMDGDGWDDADERLCSPQGTVLRDLPAADVGYGRGTVFLGGPDMLTPMFAANIDNVAPRRTFVMDLTEDDPMAAAFALSAHSASAHEGHRADDLGTFAVLTEWQGNTKPITRVLTYDGEDLDPTEYLPDSNTIVYASAPFLSADGGEVQMLHRSSIVSLDGTAQEIESVSSYPYQALRMQDGDMLVLVDPSSAWSAGANAESSFDKKLIRLNWNESFDAYYTSDEYNLPTTLTSGANTFNAAPGKMVMDGEGNVHWVVPTTNGSAVDYDHVVINGTSPFVHHVGAVTGLDFGTYSSNSFGLDWSAAGGVRLSYMMSNQSIGLAELNVSGASTVTVLPGGPLPSDLSTIGHVTDAAGQSTVLWVDYDDDTSPAKLFAPPLRVDPAADASWTPVDEDNDGVCDASLGAMLHFAEEDLLWEAGLFSAAEPLHFGGYEVTGVTALTSLPNGLVLNTTTGTISGTPTVAVPEGQNVTLRITSNGVTIDMVFVLRIAEPAMVSVGEFGTSSSPLNKASHMVTTEDGRRYTLSWHSTDVTGKVNGFNHANSDLVLTAYRPNGSAVVNWTSNIRSHSYTYPLDLALDADENPLVLFLAGSSSCAQASCLSENDINFPNPEQDIHYTEACTTLYSSNTYCQSWGERKKLVLASFGEEGLVEWTQHVKHRAGNSSYYNNPGEEGVSWSSYMARNVYAPYNYGMMDDDYLSIAPDGGINLAIQFCAEASLVGTFGGHEIHASRTGECHNDDDINNDKTNFMLASLTADGEVEWLTTSDVSQSPSMDTAQVKRVELDHTSDGKMLLSYTTGGQHTWGDLMLPLPQTSNSYPDHFMVMFDANGSALWYQHGNVTNGQFDVQPMVMDDGTIVVVREAPRDGTAGAYIDLGVNNSTLGRPTSSVPAGTVAYNNTSLAEHPIHIFRFRASDGARLSDAPIMGVDMQNGFLSAAPLGYRDSSGNVVESSTSLSAQTDGDRIYVLVRTVDTDARYDLIVLESDGRRATAMAATDTISSSFYQSKAAGFDASGMPVFNLRDSRGWTTPSSLYTRNPSEVVWAYDDGRTVDGLLSPVLRFASGLGHQAEHDTFVASVSGANRYTDLSESTCTSSQSALGETWSLVGTNGSTWLPSGLTFSSTCGRLVGSYPTSTTPNPYWLNMTVDGRVFSHEVMIGVAPTSMTSGFSIVFDLPATGTFTRGVSGGAYNTTLSGQGLLPATVSPALPNGLSLLANGSIVGMPTGNMSAARYVVVVCNLWNDCDREVIELEILEPMPNITYGGNNSLWIPRDSIVDEPPLNTGGAVETWSMSGTLPMGLSFDNFTGRITGTAILIQNTTSVNITATNDAGSFTVQVNVTVPGAGIALVFPTPSLSLVNGTTMQNIGGQTTGETPVSWTVSPGLPAGLQIGSTNGTIYGTPSASKAAENYTIEVTSISGATATFVLNIEVLEPVEQITLTLPLTSLDLTNNSAMQPFTGQTSGDAAVLWNVTPDLPTGLNLGTSNGTMWGTPTNVSGPVLYTITAYTTSGANDSATLTITVSADFDNDGIPDHVDPDDDNDGVLDGAEEPGCSLDPDCDDDGYGDGVDAFPVDPTEWVDTDNDGIGNNADDDDDGDGWTETEETECGNHSDLDAMDQPGDLDNDGLCDALDDVDDRPIYLVLTETELLLPVNATMAPFEVLQFGADVRSWNVTPDLPLGLSIDSEGRISGIPTVVSNLAVYTINASNDLNWATVNLSIAVLDEDADFDNDGLPDAVDPDDDNDGWSDVDEAQCGPTDPFDAEDMPDDSDNDGICDLLDDVSDLQITVTHEPRELHLTVNVTMTPVEANVTGGDVITWTAMGELPAGLSLDAQNGTISGTPTEVVADVLVQIEANNSKHSTTTWVLITVHEDTDADGIANIVDDDDDNDGWLDSEEAVCATDPLDANGVPSDLDGDGTCDRADPDIDGDGWANVQEQFCSTDPRDTEDMPSDTDEDGICNLVDTDDDNDGWADLTETLCGTNPLNTTSVPVDANRDGSCDQDLAISLSYNVGDGWFGVGEEVNLTPDLGGFEADLWAIQPALPEGLTFGSMARTSSGAITGVPLAASDETTYTVWANNSVDNTSINTSFVLGVFADHDQDGQPDEDILTEVGPIQADLDDDDDGYADTMEAACGSNPYDRTSVPEDGVEFDGVTCINADSETDDEAAFPWWACCLLLLLLLLLLFFMRDREEVLGPEPERTTVDVEAKSGTGTERDPFILKAPKPIAPMGSCMSKQTIRFHGMTPRIEVHLTELGARDEQGRFTMVDVKDEKLNGQILTADEKGALKIQLRFDDEAFNTVKGGHFESVLRFGRNSVYVRWPVEVLALEEEITPDGADDEDAEKAEMEALMLAKQAEAEAAEAKAKAEADAKEQSEKEAAEAKAKAEAEAAEAKAKAEAEAKEQSEKEAAEAKAKAEAEAAESKAKAEAEAKEQSEKEAAEAKAKAEAEAAEAKAEEEAEAKAAQEAKEQAEKEAAEAAEAQAAKEKAEAEAAEAKAKAEAEAAEAKAKAEAEAKAAQEAKEQAEKEAAEAKAKAEAEAAEAQAAKEKAEQEAAEAEAKAKAEAEAAEAKAAQEAKEQAEKEAAEAAEAQAAKEKAEAEAAEAKAKAAAAAAKKPASTKEAKKQEELERVKERAKTIDFKVLGVASTTELKEKVEKGATTLEVADADAFEEQGSASITDAKGSTMIAWTGKDGNALTGVSGVTRVFAAAATLRAKDDLQVIKGIGPFIEEKLNALGITTYRQIANMTAKLEEEVNVAIEFFPGRVKRDQWVAQAKILLGMDAKLDQKALEQAEELERIAQKSDALDFDVLGVANVADADDLQRIKGIGPFIEDKLYALSIFTFEQVGNMTPEIEEAVNVAIEFFPGRIKRDEWAKQAKALHEDKA
jgi:alpha-tubulin suppressor-like RCC1 family protein/predicted flap endonuclease-1-like 5' DNA nuclease